MSRKAKPTVQPSAQDDAALTPGGGRGVTLRDVARACGLSVYPVSRVLNGRPGVTEETAAKVRQVATELGYSLARNDVARRLSLRKSGEAPRNHLIGVLMPSHLGKVNFFVDLFRGISEEITGSGYGMLTIPTYDPVGHSPLPIRLPPVVMRGEVDGLLLHQALPADLLQKLRLDTGFGQRPIVTMMSEMADCGTVLRDERGGAKLALAHLLALGHRRILYLTRQPIGYPYTERAKGYADACAEVGVDPATCLIPVPILHDHLAEEPLQAALRAHPDATAVMAQTDPTALIACYAIQGQGRQVPGDLSVVGWDDSDAFPDAAGVNQLTSVHFDLVEMGRLAARRLIEQVEGRDSEPDNIVMPPTLVVRGSTSEPRTRTNEGRL